MRVFATILVAAVAGLSLVSLANAHKINPMSDQTLSKRCNGAGGEILSKGICMLPGGATVSCGGKGKQRACDSTAIATNSGGATTGPFGTATGPAHPGAPNPSGTPDRPSFTMPSKPTGITGGVISTH